MDTKQQLATVTLAAAGGNFKCYVDDEHEGEENVDEEDMDEKNDDDDEEDDEENMNCLLYTSPSPRDS